MVGSWIPSSSIFDGSKISSIFLMGKLLYSQFKYRVFNDFNPENVERSKVLICNVSNFGRLNF